MTLYRLTNKTSREIALAKPSGAIILRAGESINITDAEYHELSANKIINLVDVQTIPDSLPVAPKRKQDIVGIRIQHAGGGWWRVFVNGEEATDGKVRKAEAERIAAEYQ